MRIILLSLLCLTSLQAFAQTMTLETYLQEVEEKNGNVRGTRISYEAKARRNDEGTLFFRPSFFLNGEYMDDQRQTTAPAFQGTQTLRNTFRAGLAQNLRTGTKAAISYNYWKTQINGASPSLLPNKSFFDIGPQIEITQSLWRNWLGKEFNATEAVQNATTDSQRFQQQFDFKNLIMNAKNAYWRLYFAQQVLKVQKESLDRAVKLRDWNKNRVRSNLVDESELLQAEANLQSREVEYQAVLDEIETAEREFNSFRESTGKTDLRADPDIEARYILSARIPQKGEIREDVLAAIAATRAAEANAELGRERNKPNLELYGSYSINGRDKLYSQASDTAWSATRPMSVVGVRFTTPLDLGGMSNYRDSYEKEKIAADLKMKRKSYEVDREWEILTERFENFSNRLRLNQKLEKVQEEKYKTERVRYGQGRTTTFQVLQFEQDFANAQILKLRNERELIVVYNQLMLFSGDL